MFGLQPGDTLVLMADKKKGLALQTVDKLNPLMKTVFNSCLLYTSIDGGPHKRWIMWFNSKQREEPYQGLTSY